MQSTIDNRQFKLRPSKLQFFFCFTLLLIIVPVVMQAQVSLQLTPSNYNGFNISCFGKNDGSIDLTVSGGVAPYQIVWSTGDSIEDLSNIPAGYYRVKVEDSDSVPNIAEAEITLFEPRSVRILEDVHTYPNNYNISVFGACNGMLIVSAEDGVPPYSWMWTDSITATNRSSLCADRYAVEVTDANGCKTKAIIILTQPDRSDWQMTGNEGTSSDVNFIGTTDSTDLVFRTSGAVAARIGKQGEFNVNKIVTNRIVSPDSLVYMGEGTLIFNTNSHAIYGNPANLTPPNNGTNIPHKGTGLGFRSNPQGIYSISIGHDVLTRGENDIALGYKLRTEQPANPNEPRNSMVIGTGWLDTGYNQDNFKNDIPNSLMIGFNSLNPTLFVSPNTHLTNKNATGTVGICTTYVHPDYKLAVNGKIIAEEVLIKNGSVWPDYVFDQNYALMPLNILRQYISENGHLPEIPTGEELRDQGVNTSDMLRMLLRKIEELTLYTLQQQEEINMLKEKLEKENYVQH